MVEHNSVDPQDLLYGKLEYTMFSSDELRERRVPDFSYNILNLTGELYEPVVDETRLENGMEKPDWPGDAEFAVCLTHDMDHVSADYWRHSFRNSLLRAQIKLKDGTSEGYLDEFGILPALKSLVGAGVKPMMDVTKREDDALHRYEDWLKIEDEYDAHSTFFVLPEKTSISHISDPEYRYDDPVVFDGERSTVGEMVAEIDRRGWEIGLHPSWYAYDDTKELRHQKESLEDIVEGEVRSVRQHYLHYHPRRTPRAHDDAGFDFDSTLGFNQNVGFRRGSCHPWYARDVEEDEELDLVEVPLAVQDGALFRQENLDLDLDRAIEYVEMLAGQVKEVGGVLTLLWHPSAISDSVKLEAYEQILDLLDAEGAWFGSVEEVADRWIENTP